MQALGKLSALFEGAGYTVPWVFCTLAGCQGRRVPPSHRARATMCCDRLRVTHFVPCQACGGRVCSQPVVHTRFERLSSACLMDN